MITDRDRHLELGNVGRLDRTLKTVAAAALLVLLSVGASSLIRHGQNEHIRSDVETNGRLFVNKLDGHIRARFMVVQLFVDQLIHTSLPPEERFALNAPMINRMFNDLQAFNWVDSTGKISVVTPLEGNKAALGLDLMAIELPAQALKTARETNSLRATAPLNLAQGGYGFVAYAPVVKDGELAGYLNLVFEADRLMEQVLGPQLAEETFVAVEDGNLAVFGDPSQYTNNPFAISRTYEVNGRIWTITIAPTPELIGAIRNYLDEGVLIAGLILSAILTYLSFAAQRSQDLIKDREERFNLAMRGASDGLFDENRITGETYFSPRWFSILGYGAAELPQSIDTFKMLVHADDLPGVVARTEEAERNGETKLDLDFRMRHKDGTWRSIRSRALVVFKNGKIARAVGTHIDVTTAHERKIELETAARTDHLSGLRNRRGLNEELQTIYDSMAHGERMTILHVDLDRFKSINDTDGHQTGDEALKIIANRLKKFGNNFALIARVGGDEFLLVDKTNASDATILERSDKLISGISEPFECGGKQYRLSASIGISFSTQADSFDFQESAVNSDIALKHAKLAGGDRSVIFEPSMRENAVRLATILNEVEQGVMREEFHAFFQPQVDLKSQQIIGFEALARWRHPHRGVLSAAHFLPFLAQSSLARLIDALIMEQACDALELLSGTIAHDATISVNLSNELLSEPHAADVIIEDIVGRGLDPNKLCLEVLETTLLSDRNEVIVNNVTRLAAEGFRIELDDFGTGHSAISSVVNFPVSQIKIDRSLVSNVNSDAKLQAVVGTIIDLGSKLQVDVLAEGIENTPECDFLAKSGCLRGQGYYFAKPMPVEELTDWIEGWSQESKTPSGSPPVCSTR